MGNLLASICRGQLRMWPIEFGADRGKVWLGLEAENNEAKPLWKPMHLQPFFQVEGRRAPQLNRLRISRGQQGRRLKADGNKERHKARMVEGEEAEDLFNRGLCLPSGTAMTNEDLDRVVHVIKGVARR